MTSSDGVVMLAVVWGFVAGFFSAYFISECDWKRRLTIAKLAYYDSETGKFKLKEWRE